MKRCVSLRSGDQPKTQLVVRRLPQFHALLGGPGDGLLVQGNVGNISALDRHRLAYQGLTLGRVKFGRNLGQHGVKGRME